MSDHLKPGCALDRLTADVTFARDGRVDRVEEAQVLAQSAHDPHVIDGLSRFAGVVLDDEPEVEAPQVLRIAGG